MTAATTRPDASTLWGTMPGWGIVADLTPPELLAARQLYLLRRLIAAALVGVIVLSGAGYFLATMKHRSAAADLDAANSETTQLQVAANKYNGVTQIETTVDGIRGQVATVMQDDVDVPTLVARVRLALPRTMSIENLSVTLTPAGADTTDSSSLDSSGRPEVGKVTVSGSGQSLDDLPAFVDNLAAIRGVVNVVPGSNTVSTSGAQFSLTFSLTDQLYSHRYDLSSTSSSASAGGQ